jgi:PDZ domain-containing protein
MTVSSSVDTSEGIVTPPEDPSPSPGWSRRRQAIVGFAVLVVVGFLISAAVVELPYYAFRPGSVRNTTPLVDIEGVDTFRPEGSISYTTVSLRPVTLIGLVQGWLDSDIDIHERDEVLGDRDPEENRQLNLALMDNSKLTATQVALEQLNYDVHETATGNTVVDVVRGTPAEGKLEPGDTIVAVDGERIDEPDDLTELMADKRPGDEVTLTIQPFQGTDGAAATDADGNGERDEEDVAIELAANPDDPEKGFIGIQHGPAGYDLDLPFDINFDTGDVGGPSAGLAFTLTLIDALTEGELTGGEAVAVTGEINADGTVGAVGGTGQKAAAVRRAGIDVFLVPDDDVDYQAAVEHAGDVEVIRVGTVEEALEALAELGGNGLDLPDLEAPPSGGSS